MAMCLKKVSSSLPSLAVPAATGRSSGIVPGRGRSCLIPMPTKSFPLTTHRVSICMSLPTSPPLIPPLLIRDNDSLLKYLRQPEMFAPAEAEDGIKMEKLRERMQQALRGACHSNPVEAMKMMDELQRLGLAYQFQQDIHEILEKCRHGHPDNEDLFSASLRFRLLRHDGYQISPDIFRKFMNKDGTFDESLSLDTAGMLSLFEASYMGAIEEDVLSEAKEFTQVHLKKKKSVPDMAPQLRRQVQQALEIPRHLRMARLESRKYIEECEEQGYHNSALLELAKLEYNRVQSLHQMELAELSRWWKQLGLVDKLSFARDRPLECFLWTVGILPEPKYSGCRIELAKTIAILLVIDDIFDTHGSPNELALFTHAIQRWDLDAMENLPEYMKICYMALYNTTNEIAYKVLKENGWSVLPYLKRTWIDMVEGFHLEAKWLNSGYIPKLEEYIENGVTTAGAYMALVHLFFLVGHGVTDENVKLLMNPYPKLFSCAGRILRLWDDLGTAKEEQERGDLASSIQLFMRENNITKESEGRDRVMQLIHRMWQELNGELMVANPFPIPVIKAAFNMSRAAQVVYQHEEDSYFSSVDNYVQALFFTPID